MEPARKKGVKRATDRPDHAEMVANWLSPLMAHSPLEGTLVEIIPKPGKDHFDLRVTVSAMAGSQEKREKLLDIAQWIKNVQAGDLVKSLCEKPVFGDPSQIALSRAHFTLSESDFDAITGQIIVRFSFQGTESKRGFLQALAEQADRNMSHERQRGA